MKTMKTTQFGMVGVLLALCASAVIAQEIAPPSKTASQEAAPLLKTAFDAETGGWIASGDGAKTSVTQDKTKVKEGKGSLLFDYTLEKGKTHTLMLMVEQGKLEKMKSLRFWVRADHTAPLAVTMQEKDGGRYNAVFTAPNQQWQEVELAPSDFTPGTEAHDPKDPNGKLDMDKVVSIGIIDLGTFFIQSDDANLQKMFATPKGFHTLLLNDFAVRSDAPSAASTDKKSIALDGIARPQIGWIGLGAVTISAATGKPLDGKSLKAAYHQSAGQIIGLMRGIPAGAMAGKTQIKFSVAASKATKLLIQVEERDGGKYNVMVDVLADKARTEITQALSDFKMADDSKDANDKLDPEQIKSILILDISGMVDSVDTDNTLWISNLRATTK